MDKLKVFENKQIRAVWNAEQEDWFFSVVDVVGVLTDSSDYQASRNYWKVLKNRLKKEGSELVTNCNRLKLLSSDGKYYMQDVLNTAGVLRLVQSIPSPKAEPFKMWLAQVGSERLDEMRKELTDEWKARGIEREKDYAILTNEMTKAWSGMTVAEYKQLKGLHKESLRDNMTNIELVLNMLAEVTTTAISRQEQPDTFEQSKTIAKRGGSVAKNARTDIERQLGQTVVSPLNASDKQALEIKSSDDDTD